MKRYEVKYAVNRTVGDVVLLGDGRNANILAAHELDAKSVTEFLLLTVTLEDPRDTIKVLSVTEQYIGTLAP